MAILTEASVVVRLVITKEDGVAAIVAQAESLDSTGEPIRRLSRNITDQLSQARRDGALALLNDVETAIKNQWQIP